MNSYTEMIKAQMSITEFVVIQTLIDGMKLCKRKFVTVEELETLLEKEMRAMII